jgi:hypothetical protein
MKLSLPQNDTLFLNHDPATKCVPKILPKVHFSLIRECDVYLPPFVDQNKAYESIDVLLKPNHSSILSMSLRRVAWDETTNAT